MERHFCITILIKVCSSFIYCKAWRHEIESIKIIYLDAIESLICFQTLMMGKLWHLILMWNRAISWKLLFDGNIVAQATEFPG